MDKLNDIKLFIYSNKKRIIIVTLIVVAFCSITLLFLNKNRLKSNKSLVYENLVTEKAEVNTENTLENEKEETETEYYYVDVKGYVNNPGVYSIEKGKRVVDAINQAGGLKNGANTSLLNLSMMIRDQMVIVVYSNTEIKNLNSVKETAKKEESICTNVIKNDACIVNSNKDTNDQNTTSDDKKEEKTNDIASEKVNINTASKEVLMTLSKIGEAKAIAIIKYREENGCFNTIEDIKKVSGIGNSLFESIKDFITV